MVRAPPRIVTAVALGLLVAVASRGARGQAPDAAALDEAKRLFREGNELRKAGDCEGAVVRYLRSRRIVASVSNTMNAAFCMDQIQRYDEELELYEELVTRFRNELTDADRQSILLAMQALRRRLGSVDVAANVDGTLVIDGRSRGQLPLSAAVRVLPGRRTIRVIKDGWDTFDTVVDVVAGQTVRVDAKLSPLARAGRLRVECAGLEGADVHIDDAVVGTCPWEGRLAPGAHVYWTRKGERGSAPKLATVLDGQTAVVRAIGEPLEAEFAIGTEPASAQVSIDGVLVGKGRWRGALPVGAHVIEAREEGYATARLHRGSGARGDVALRLAVDAAHPRWAPERRGSFVVDARVGPVLGKFTGAVRDGCGAGCSASIAYGISAVARGGYVFSSGFGVSIDAGYLMVRQSVDGRSTALNPVGHPPGTDVGKADDRIQWSGFVLGASGSYRTAGSWPLEARVGGGIVIGAVADNRSGVFVNTWKQSFEVGQLDRQSATYLYLGPELRFGRRIGQRMRLSLAVQAQLYLALDKPAWRNTDVVPTSPTPDSQGDGGATFPSESLLGDAILLLSPSMALEVDL
jgi:hypothetical protein